MLLPHLHKAVVIVGNSATFFMAEETDANTIPKTEIELEAWMKINCFNFESYSINGNAIFEGYGIEKVDGTFIWYYSERGEKRNLKYFESEAEIIKFAYEQMISDKWAKTHCIGFTTNRAEVLELTQELNILGIEFMQDEIPYYGHSNLVVRTFVFGCDHNKVSHLKAKFYREP